MFKLLKDLTRAPEPLVASSTSHDEHLSPPRRAARSRSASLTTRSRSGSVNAPTGESGIQQVLDSAEEAAEEVTETDGDAIKVKCLVKSLDDVNQTMAYVETFSQLLSVPGTAESRRAFRRHGGFGKLVEALDDLAWKSKADDISEDEWQVFEVQRAEGQRLWFEVLAWSTRDREGAAQWNATAGYESLGPRLRRLSMTEDGGRLLADPEVLGLLLSHILDNNYTLRSFFVDPGAIDSTLASDTLGDKLGDVVVRRPNALPLLWSYLWGREASEDESELPATTSSFADDGLLSGEAEQDEARSRLLLMTVRILDTAARSSKSNALVIRSHLPDLPEFLLTRLYGWEPKRHFDDTFPARVEWYENAHAEEAEPRPPWIAPSEGFRKAYLSLLQRLLERGTATHLSWRLIQLVRKVPPKAERPESQSLPGSGAATPTGRSSPSREDDTPSKPFRGRTPLKISVAPTPEPEDETLNHEVLELIQIAMKSRNPSSFVFRGGRGNAEGGLEIPELGRLWPNSTKGFVFSSWVYVSHLNNAITLVELSQKDRKYPLLRVRVLENSQIGITSTVYNEDDESEPEEVVCGAIEALIPHNEWVHFALACRKGRSAQGGGGEARLFVNGRRVGAVRVAYPTPRPAPKMSFQQQQHPPHHNHLHHRPTPTEDIRVSVGRSFPPPKNEEDSETSSIGHATANDWMLGRTFMLEEVITEDLMQLLYRLGPRYHGNFQEALGKFLTYEDATSINIHLHCVATAAQQKATALLPANSALVRAISTGPAFPEEDILFSLAAKDELDSSEGKDYVLNGAVPHASRSRDFKFGRAELVGNVELFSTVDFDDSISAAGGCLVILKLVDLARTSEELLTTLSILKDMLKYGWKASEEMERIHGFELLAAVLQPKMATTVDAACAKLLLSILGISDDAKSATVHCSAGYRAIGLNFELWSKAPLDVLKLYLDHFEHLLVTSERKRFNALRTFQKSGIVRKSLFAIRSGLFEPPAVPLVVDTLQLALAVRWSAEDAIKPVFSYLVSALCQNTANLQVSSEPHQSQAPAALILEKLAEFLKNNKRLVKLNKAIALHRLLVIFLQSNPAPYVAIPCLDILALCLSTPGVESFHRQFESEGGFALLARTLAPLWNDEIQETVFSMIFGSTGTAASSIACPAAIAAPMAALELLLQAECEASGGTGNDLSRSIGSLRSLTITSKAGDDDDEDTENEIPADDRLEQLLLKLAEVYRQSSPFRRAITVRRIEAILPTMVDFAAMSVTSSQPERAENQRVAAVRFLTALIELSKAPSTVITQLKAVVEQLRSTLSPQSRSSTLPGSVPRSPAVRPTPLRRGSSNLASSFTNTFSSSPTASPIRRRPSQDAGTFSALTRVRSQSSQKHVSLRRTLSGESILREEQDKNAAWRMIIISTDAQKFSAMTLDRKEHWHRLSQVDWPRLVAALRAENGVWAEDNGPVTWRLDGSEGPLRMRNKLERHDAVSTEGPVGGRRKARDAIPSADELSSAVSRVAAAPWEDPFALALGDSAPIQEEEHHATPPKPTVDGDHSEEESFQEVEDDSSNKLRLVSRALQAGDTVEEAHNIVRIVGVDALPGLLILGKRNLYLIDGLVQTAEGQVVEADQAPRDVLSIPSGTLADLDSNDQRSHRWPYSDVVETNKRAFLFRDVALELYFADKQNFLIVCKDRKERSAVVSKMAYKVGNGPKSIVNSLVLDAIARAVVDTRAEQLDAMTRKWQNREISNFAYIQMLNQHANRTPNDVTQYPVFPWVIADYASQILDLTRSASYRDLTLPMGALTPARKEAAVERYKATEDVGEPPFHYGTHYSSSMIVCGYMIRLSPFTEIFLALQGGNFDLADRLFSSIPKAWDSASNTNRGDVRELIPEFFYSPTFLVNLNHHDFGKKQVSGDAVDDVVLPPWALDDPLLFVHLNREALESDMVSRHLPAWIDLTFGYKQRDPASFNCFHPLSYRGAVDLDKMEDEGEKAASTAIIHNFGQTPRQIFKGPHPSKYLNGRTTLPCNTRFGVAEHWQMLLRSIKPIAEVITPIHHIIDPFMPEARPTVHQRCRLGVPGNAYLSVQYGFADESIRVYFQETGQRLVYITEGIDVAHASFVSSTLLVTISSLGVITAWRLTVKGNGYRRGETSLVREATLRGHDRAVTCLATSSAWSFLVTGTDNGSAMVWDMNRLRYTRTIQTPRNDPIKFISINETNGHIALASERYLYMFSLNGHPIAATSVEGGRFPTLNEPEEPQYFTGGISFLNREFLRWGDCFVIGIGPEVALYRCVPGVRRFEDQDVEPWRLVKQGILHADDWEHGDVTAVKFVGETLYAAFEGEEEGSKFPLYQWSLPDKDQRHVPESIVACMQPGCTRTFGLLEPRRHCGGCGGAFCGSHAVHVEFFDSRYCERCRQRLAHASAIGLVGRSRAVSQVGSAAGSQAGSRVVSRRPSVSFGDTPPRGRVVVQASTPGSRSGSRSTPLRSSTTDLATANKPDTPARRSTNATT